MDTSGGIVAASREFEPSYLDGCSLHISTWFRPAACCQELQAAFHRDVHKSEGGPHIAWSAFVIYLSAISTHTAVQVYLNREL